MSTESSDSLSKFSQFMLCYCLFHLLKDLKFGDNNSDNNSSILVMGSYVYFVLQLMPSEHKNDNT